MPRAHELRSASLVTIGGALALLAGCPADDLCLPEADSERVLHVQPPTAPGPDNSTVVGTFSSIQSALDAVGDGRGRATLCVADGTYYEQLVVPADTHLVAAGSVRLRPPQTRASALPTDVDRVLLTLESGTAGSIVVDGFDLRKGGLCVDARGAGAVVLNDTAVVDCAVGLRARGGVDVTLHEVALEDHAIRGVDIVASSLRTESNTTLLRNGRPSTSHDQTELIELDPELLWTAGLTPGRGALIATDSDITLVQTFVDESEYRGGVIDLTGGSLTLRNVELGAQRSADNTEGFVAGESGGNGPAVAARSAQLDVDGLMARTESQGLFSLEGGSDLKAVNVAWIGRMATTASAGTRGPAVHADGGGSVILWHASLLGPEGQPGLRFSGDAVTTLDLANSIVWGHDASAGLVVEGADPDLDIRYSLFQDSSVDGAQMITALEPGWVLTGDGYVVESSSPGRCRGAGNLEVNVDLFGNPRPFEAGKAPDLGSVELQEPCP
ncbi:MAG: hypothetical protein KDA24_17820 [Deltaproteobacteria bacterium]|nr:hypothetical protein [Deltaproteobacteria bacterium]